MRTRRDDLIVETQHLIDEGLIKTPTDVADHLTHEEIATIADWLLQHFANQQAETQRLIQHTNDY